MTTWLYVVFNCASQPEITTIQNPARFDWEPLSKIDCYRLDFETVLKSQSQKPLNKSSRQAHRMDYVGIGITIRTYLERFGAAGTWLYGVNLLKGMVGACGFEPQTPTVSTPSLLKSHSA